MIIAKQSKNKFLTKLAVTHCFNYAFLLSDPTNLK